MNKGSNGQIPSSVSGHSKAKERPNPVVVERGNEHCGRTTSSEYVRPCPLVQIVIYIIYITAYIFFLKKKNYISKQSKKPIFIYAKKIGNLKKMSNKKNIIRDLAQAISWITDPKRRKVQLKAKPAAFQYGPSKPSNTSNHCPKIFHFIKAKRPKFGFLFLGIKIYIFIIVYVCVYII